MKLWHVCALHSEEVERKVTGTSKSVRQVLWSACSPQRSGWLFNNQRVRHALSPLQRALLPSGTTSNEALHSEINSWTRSTHEVHRSTLKLKLRLPRAILLPDKPPMAWSWPAALEHRFGTMKAGKPTHRGKENLRCIQEQCCAATHEKSFCVALQKQHPLSSHAS